MTCLHRQCIQFLLVTSLQHSRHSLDTKSAATLAHLFVTSGVDYCSAVLVGVKNDKQQTAMSVERSSPCGQQCPTSSTEACSNSSILSVQLPALSSASVPHGIVPSSRRCHIPATTPIRHLTAPGRNEPLAQLLWQMAILCGWPVRLEFPAGQLAGSDYWREQF